MSSRREKARLAGQAVLFDFKTEASKKVVNRCILRAILIESGWENACVLSVRSHMTALGTPSATLQATFGYRTMSFFYVSCNLGSENAHVSTGTLHKGALTMGEISRFKNVPLKEKDADHWDIQHLYQHTLGGLREIGRYEEPVDSISCTSWADDYLLFDSGGSLITPSYRCDARTSTQGMNEVLSKVEWETIYRETGVTQVPSNTLFQLGGETWRRMRRAHHLMPVADAFNYLLTGVPCVEVSQASATQLYNPVTKGWSERLAKALRLSRDLLPPVVTAGTELGALKPEIAKETGLHDTRVLASCSHEIAAALMGMPVANEEDWGYLSLGRYSVMGTQLARPIISCESRDLNFTNELGYGGMVRFSRRMAGFWLLEECRRSWKEGDKELDTDVVMHLAACSEPFECLINPSDSSFLEPGDMPSKIKDFCRRTGQHVPHKPGAIVRCILESLALQYRKMLKELEATTGKSLSHVYLFGDISNSLLNHFTANALQIPLVIAPPDVTDIGNVMVQALALKHVKSLEQAREILRNSFKTEVISPHAAVWNSAYDRFAELAVESASVAVES